MSVSSQPLAGGSRVGNPVSRGSRDRREGEREETEEEQEIEREREGEEGRAEEKERGGKAPDGDRRKEK